MYKKSEIPGNGLKNFQNVFKMLTMLVLHYNAKTKQHFQILVFAQKQLKIICETFPNQWANKTFLVRHHFFYVILAHYEYDLTWAKNVQILVFAQK